MNQRELTKIRNVLIVAEQGKQKMDYDAVYIYADGPGRVRQITLSIGFTQYGNLGKVLAAYAKEGGKYGAELGAYVSRMSNPATVNDRKLIETLKKAGADPVMQKTQEEMFDLLYLAKAIEWGEKEGFQLPLSFLVIADSFLHSGSILSTIRNKFAEKTPASGGVERDWIEQYVDARHTWLATHSNKLLHNTVYRTKYYKRLISDGDWTLEDYHNVAMNGVKPLAAPV